MNNKKSMRGLLPLLALMLLITSCNLFDTITGSIATAGTWTDDLYGGKIIITATTYESYYTPYGTATSEDAYVLSHKGTINNFNNYALNAGSTTTETTEYGYFTVRYEGGSGDGKYGIVRWKSLETTEGVTTMSYAEGNNAVYDSNFALVSAAVYYDTAADAEAGMDDTYFAIYTNGMTKK